MGLELKNPNDGKKYFRLSSYEINPWSLKSSYEALSSSNSSLRQVLVGNSSALNTFIVLATFDGQALDFVRFVYSINSSLSLPINIQSLSFTISLNMTLTTQLSSYLTPAL